MGAPDIAPFAYGAQGDIPVVGDWDGNGTTTVGVARAGAGVLTWYLRNRNSSGAPDIAPFAYGSAGTTPVVGDWDGDRVTTVGAAMNRRDEAAVAGTVTIVAVDAPMRADSYWTAQMLATWSPVAVWAVVVVAAPIVFGVCTLIFSLAGGALSDRIGRRPVMIWPRAALLLLAAPAYGLVAHERNAMSLLAVTALLAALSQATRGLFALMENYPQLKANDNVKQLQEELTSTENKIAFSRQFYNDSANSYNTRRQSFPAVLAAASLGFGPMDLFTMPEAEREVPKVALR